jgi:outer membrane receptor protein involved in Fe transport
MDRATGYLLNLPITDQGFFAHSRFETLAVVPSISIELPENWTTKVTGTYGIDTTDSRSNSYSFGALSTVVGRFNNQSLALEAGAQGPLFALPAGDVRLAIGGGARRYRLVADNGAVHIRRHRNNYFAYAEIYAPLVSPAQDIPFVHRASLTGALRLEDYSDSGRVITPKIGFIYDPIKGLSLKATWGRSFKLPTLYQQYSGYAAVLLPVAGYGNRFPNGSTYLQVLGSNEHEQAERSKNWVLSAEAKPVQALQISASYFRIDYTDRVAPPLLSAAGALTNPVYGSFVTLDPTAAQIASIADGALGGLLNGTGRPYDPGNVVAILDIRDRNIARQVYHGVDLSLRYGLKLTSDKALVLTGSGTWLKSDQQLLRGSAFTALSGTIFHPPHFKARGGATFDGGRFSVATFVNYTGSVSDNRRAIGVEVGSMTTIDLTARLNMGRATEISLNALNLFNAKPAAIYTTSPYDTPFDTTNFSAIGRFLGLSISHRW